MIASIPQLQSALKFYLNTILIQNLAHIPYKFKIFFH